MSGYVVIVEHDETRGYSTWSPDLPGCVAAASDWEECVQLMREDGLPVPEPTAVASMLVTAA